MNIYKLLFTGLFAVFLSCQKEETTSIYSDFEIKIGTTLIEENTSVTLPTYALLEAKITSPLRSNEKIEWDFGNGQKSEELEPLFYYEEPGDYPIALTVTKGSSRVVSSKNILVQQRTIDMIKINSISLASAIPTLQPGMINKIAIFFRVYQKNKNEAIPTLNDGIYDATKIYESGTQEFFLQQDNELTFSNINGSVVLLPPGQAGDNLGYCLYARVNGKDHLLLSNWGALGVNFQEDISNQSSTYDMSLTGTSLTIFGKY